MKDARIDAYIAKAAEFARPILEELRARVHRACPDAVETMKWSMPFFEYQGKPFCNMAAFKQHCAFGFWHAGMRGNGASADAMGQFGRIESLRDLPKAKEFAQLVAQAKKLTDEGVKAPAKARASAQPLEIPAELAAALKKNAKARATFESFSNSKRKEYVEWIAGAKREETRAQRLATTLEWLAEGKALHWKYERC